MSRWSCRSLRSSAQPIASVPSRRRAARTGSSLSADSSEPARTSAARADISEAPPFLEPAAGDLREHVLERPDAEAPTQLARRADRGDRAAVHDRDALALALGLLHLVRGDDDRRAGPRSARGARASAPRSRGRRTRGSRRAVSAPSIEIAWRTARPSRTTSWPATQAVPRAGRSSVVRTRIVVVLPAPLGPRRPNASPAATSNEIHRDRLERAEAHDEVVDDDDALGALLRARERAHRPTSASLRARRTSAAFAVRLTSCSRSSGSSASSTSQ